MEQMMYFLVSLMGVHLQLTVSLLILLVLPTISTFLYGVIVGYDSTLYFYDSFPEFLLSDVRFIIFWPFIWPMIVGFIVGKFFALLYKFILYPSIRKKDEDHWFD